MPFELNINDEDVLSTYEGDELSAATLYTNIMKHGGNHNNIASELGTTPKKVRRYKVEGRKPRGIKGLKKLRDYGLHPINMDSANLEIFNLLASITFWRGTIASRNDSSISTIGQTIFNPTNEDQLEVIKKIAKATGIYLKPTKKNHFRTDYELSRLLISAGFETGSKQENETLIPDYIFNAVKYIEQNINKSIIPPDLPKVIQLVEDFVSTMLYFRLKLNRNDKLIHLTAYKKPDIAEEQAKLIKRAINSVVPDARIGIHGPYETTDKKNQPAGTFKTRLNLYNYESELAILYKNFNTRVKTVCAAHIR